MNILRTLMLIGISTTLSGCSWIFPSSDFSSSNWHSTEKVATRSADTEHMPPRYAPVQHAQISMPRVDESATIEQFKKVTAQLTSPRLTSHQVAGVMPALQKDLNRETELTSCAMQRTSMGSGFRASIDERMSIYTAQVESLAASSLSPSIKARLVRGLDTEFEQLQKKVLGLNYLRDTLYSLCQMHSLGVIDKTAYQASMNSLMKTAAQNLRLQPVQTRLQFTTTPAENLHKVSRSPR